MKTAFVTAFLMLASLACAEAPDAEAPEAKAPVAKIAGPEKANQGDIIVLSVSGAPKHAKWKVDASGVDVPQDTAVADLEKTAEQLREAGFDVQAPPRDAPPIYLELDKGKRLILSSYRGTYLVSLAVGNDDGVDQTTFKVVVGAPKPKPDDPDPPEPDPDPEPKPTPEPNLPAGKFGLAIKSWRASQQVKSEKRAEEAKVLAAALLTAVAATDGQGMIDQFAAAMKARFNATQKTAWEPWRASYLAELSALQGSGKLSEKADFVTAFGEMAVGLSAVEK